jgi:hypothetical protein
MEEKTMLGKEKGYFVMGEGDQVVYSSSRPNEAEVVTSENFVNALVQGCKNIIQSFADGPDNSEVYAFNLFADEHESIYVYMNTIPRFEKTLEAYRNKFPNKFTEYSDTNALKYGQGDFDFQFWQEHMGDHGRLVEAFENIAYAARNMEESSSDEELDEPLIAFEAGIIRGGYVALALKAVQCLIAEDAFAPLNKAASFIAFAASGNDYLDYGTMMRKTIAPDLLYELFPDLREKDAKFRHELEQIKHLNISEYLDYWFPAVHSKYGSVSPYIYAKSEYDIFLQLERFGSELADECLWRLNQLMSLQDQELSDSEAWCIYYYAEALHFSGPLTREQREQCTALAGLMLQSKQDLKDAAIELKKLSSI